MEARSDRYRVPLHGECNVPGTRTQVPSASGLAFRCRDPSHGSIALTLEGAIARRTIVTSSGGIEIGGGP